MASKPRGRGYAINAARNQTTELRRPGEAGLLERFGNTTQNHSKPTEEIKDLEVKSVPKTADAPPPLEKPSSNSSLPSSSAKVSSKPSEYEFANLCDRISQMELSLPKVDLDAFAEKLKTMCKTSNQLEMCAEELFQFALKSKWNAHAIAVFCNSHGDITVDQTKLRNLLFKKLQGNYMEKNKVYLELDKFLLSAAFACEIFHHVRVGGMCLKVLAHPVLDYCGMLIDGASHREIEVFIEQFPKCYKNLKENDPNGLDDLLTKIRKQLVSETTSVMVKAMLLEMFELIVTDWKDLSSSAKNLYETLSKPIVRICD